MTKRITEHGPSPNTIRRVFDLKQHVADRSVCDMKVQSYREQTAPHTFESLACAAQRSFKSNTPNNYSAVLCLLNHEFDRSLLL